MQVSVTTEAGRRYKLRDETSQALAATCIIHVLIVQLPFVHLVGGSLLMHLN